MSLSISNFEDVKATRHSVVSVTIPVIVATIISSIIFIECIAYALRGITQVSPTFAPLDRMPNLEESIVQIKLDVMQKVNDVELILLGDSSGLMGVDGALFAELTQRTAYNLCTIGFLGVEGHILLLEQWIANRGRPTAVIYYFAPVVLQQTKSQIDEIGYLRRLRQVLNLEDTSYAIPSMQYRDYARQYLAPQSIFDDVPRGAWPSHAETIAIMDKSSGSMLEISRPDWSTVPQLTGVVSPYQYESLNRLVELCEKFEVTLLLIANPLPEIANTESNEIYLSNVKQVISGVAGHASHVRLYEPTFRYYPNEQCANLNHLHPIAVTRNTETIAAWVREIVLDVQ